MDHQKERDRRGQCQDDDPGAVHELRRDDDDQRRDGRYGTEGIDGQPHPVGSSALPAPVHHHADLAHREREKRTDGEKRDQAIGDAAEGDQQQACRDGQERDADGEHEAAVGHGEAARQESVLGNEPAEAGKPTKLVLAERHKTASTLAMAT